VKQSREEQQSSVSPQSKPRSLARGTKHAITPRPSELIDIEVFKTWIDNLDSASEEAYLSFCKDNNSIIECFLYARFLGYEGSIVACDLWVNSEFEKPDHRKVLLNEIEEMQEDIRKLRQAVEDDIVKRDAGVARIASMQKELRGTIAQLDLFTSSRDRKGLLMAGADRAIRELVFIFKDDPIEIPLHEASMSVWARMQLEE
jgi:hypothetical protein